jgi:hypothetical protein
MAGTADLGAPPDWGAYLTYENVSSERKSLVKFENAGHSIFGDHCRRLPEMAALFYPWGCPADPTWDLDRAHDLINHLVTAFFLSELKGDQEAKAALMPEAVAFPGIAYETTFE